MVNEDQKGIVASEVILKRWKQGSNTRREWGGWVSGLRLPVPRHEWGP